MDNKDGDGKRVENGGNCGGGTDTITRQRVDVAELLPTDDTLYRRPRITHNN